MVPKMAASIWREKKKKTNTGPLPEIFPGTSDRAPLRTPSKLFLSYLRPEDGIVHKGLGLAHRPLVYSHLFAVAGTVQRQEDGNGPNIRGITKGSSKIYWGNHCKATSHVPGLQKRTDEQVGKAPLKLEMQKWK